LSLTIPIQGEDNFSAKKRGGALEINKEIVDAKVSRNTKISELENLSKF
jgi:hypothetical protein